MSELRLRDHTQPCEHDAEPDRIGALLTRNRFWSCDHPNGCPGGREVVLREWAQVPTKHYDPREGPQGNRMPVYVMVEGDDEWYQDSVNHLATAIAWLTQGTVLIIGTNEAQAILDKLTEALDAAGVEATDAKEGDDE